MAQDTRGIREGMRAYSSDGHSLGKVVGLEANGFEIERGFFLPKDFLVAFDDVVRVRADEVLLRLTAEDLKQAWRRTLIDDAERASAPGGDSVEPEESITPRVGRRDDTGLQAESGESHRT